jgi:hypothetical protein
MGDRQRLPNQKLIMKEKLCTADSSPQPHGNQRDTILQFVQKSISRQKLPIPLNTLQIAEGTKIPYLATWHYLKQLESAGLVVQADYSPNPFVLLLPIFPLAQQKVFLKNHCLRIYDPSTGEIRPRGTRDFALWVIA